MAEVAFKITRIQCLATSDPNGTDEVFFYLQSDADSWIRYPQAAPAVMRMVPKPERDESYINQPMDDNDNPAYCDLAPGQDGIPAMMAQCDSCVQITAMDMDHVGDSDTTDYLGTACLMVSQASGSLVMTNGLSSYYVLDFEQTPVEGA